MERANRVGRGQRSTEPETAAFENLIPLAIVIAAGCTPCAERMVEAAVRRGTPSALIARSLGIVALVASAECLADAVGPEIVARMWKPLRAARRTLRERTAGATETARCGQTHGLGPDREDGCCGESRPPADRKAGPPGPRGHLRGTQGP